MTIKTDSDQRQAALNTQASFIVQAPAGSGKTELLVSRFLALIANTGVHPYQVYAITFTKKAQFEMKNRIESILKLAESKSKPATHQLTSYQLACQVLKLDQQQQWRLLDQIDQLNIMTIDSLTQGLLDHLRPTSDQYNLSSYPQMIYHAAIEQAITSQQCPANVKLAIERLLVLTQNNLKQLIDISCQMLQERDNWLPYLPVFNSHNNQPKKIAQRLNQWIDYKLNSFHEATDTKLLESLKEYYQKTHPEHRHPSTLTHAHWKYLLSLILTKSKTYRKRIHRKALEPHLQDEQIKALKAHHQALIECLETHLDFDEILFIDRLPSSDVIDKQNDLIQAFSVWLPYIAANLNIYLQQHKVADYTYYSLELQSLLSHENLNQHYLLDQKIQHLLIDEFQDTSYSQYQLLIKLTAHWQHSNKTVFLVGDPMQSIYRFRKAEVELFTYIQKNGLGNLTLRPIQLRYNYRSSPAIVQSVNDIFSTLVNHKSNGMLSTVSFTSSICGRPEPKHPSGVHSHWIDSDLDSCEYQTITNIIKNTTKHYPTQTIAILVRSRSQIKPLCHYLEQQNIPFIGDDLIPIGQSQWLHDIIYATLLLFDQQDQLTWYHTLQSPTVGLSQQSLSLLQWQFDDLDQWVEQLSALSNQHETLKSFLEIYQHTLEHINTLCSRNIINDYWRQLGFLQNIDHSHVHMSMTLLDIIDELSINSQRINKQTFMPLIDKKFIDHNPNEATQLFILTIHKAKGLEFDHVILPCLHKKTRALEKKPLYIETLNDPSGHLSIIAPMDNKESPSELYQFLHEQNRSKDQYERIRLFYVACTRAKYKLHFTALVPSNTTSSNRSSVLINKLRGLYPNKTPAYNQIRTSLNQHSSVVKAQHTMSHFHPEPEQSDLDDDNVSIDQIRGTICHLIIEKSSGCPIKLNEIQPFLPYLCHSLVPSFNRLQHGNLINEAYHIIQKWYSIDWVQWLLKQPNSCKNHEIAFEHRYQNNIHVIRIDYLLQYGKTQWIVDFKTMHTPTLKQCMKLQQQLNHYAAILKQHQTDCLYCCLCPLLSNKLIVWRYMESKSSELVIIENNNQLDDFLKESSMKSREI